MELRHLRNFRLLAEELNFTRAARRAHVSQSSLSEQILRLEDILGVKLFDRSPHHVRMTEAGEALYRELPDLLDHLGRVLETTRLAGGHPRRRLRIGYSSSMALNSPMPRIVQTFRQSYPRTDTVLLEHSSTDFERMLTEGEVDCFFIPNPPAHTRIASLPILFDPVLCCLPPGHRLAGKSEVRLEDLRDVPVIMPTAGARFGVYVMTAFLAAEVEPKVVANISQPTVLLTMVSTGAGVSFIPSSLAGLVPEGVPLRPLGSPVLKVPFSFVWDTGRANPAVDDMVAIVRAAVSRAIPEPAPPGAQTPV